MPQHRFGEKLMTCFCPLCHSSYKRFIFWSGNGVPHVYCNLCKKTVSRISSNSLIDRVDTGESSISGLGHRRSSSGGTNRKGQSVYSMP